MTTEPPTFTTATLSGPLRLRWWIRRRDSRRGIQLPPSLGDTPCLPCQEFYVPFWAWPLEIVDRIFRR